QCLQGNALLLDLPRRAVSKAPQDRNGRAPPLQGMLQEESADQGRQHQQRRLRRMPNTVPSTVSEAALACSTRSMSHSSSSARSLRQIRSGWSAKNRTRVAVSCSILRLISSAVFAGTRSAVVAVIALLQSSFSAGGMAGTIATRST